MNSNEHPENQSQTGQAGRMRLIVDVELTAAGYQPGRAADILEAVASAVRSLAEYCVALKGKRSPEL
ncbi:hypothetical protein AWV80_08475 [Cupriavidus sp. UYMU48A]|nr:hypothetical protein AWV80_08475 [Cupriavidus sp. UYMU48A]